jgi:cytochrome c-type biogenesis protein CcmE
LLNTGAFGHLKLKYFIGGGILLVVAAYLIYLSFDTSVSYYVTVSEFFDKGTELHDTNVRVAGKVVGSSVEWDAEDIELSFAITEGDESMMVVYEGARPSGFKDDVSILVEGKYRSDGKFHASQLIMSCPSKYESAVE